MKQGWGKVFGNKPSKSSQIEMQPYLCILCNDDMVRFAHAGAYAHHMNARHKFHRAYDLSLPIPSAWKGYAWCAYFDKELDRQYICLVADSNRTGKLL